MWMPPVSFSGELMRLVGLLPHSSETPLLFLGRVEMSTYSPLSLDFFPFVLGEALRKDMHFLFFFFFFFLPRFGFLSSLPLSDRRDRAIFFRLPLPLPFPRKQFKQRFLLLSAVDSGASENLIPLPLPFFPLRYRRLPPL